MNYIQNNTQMTKFKMNAQAAFILNTFTLMTFMAASSAPAPLYRLYQQIWHFSDATLTLIFAAYAFGMLVTLLVMGALSDYIGRRPVILLAIIIEIVSMSSFLFAQNTEMLFAARALQGIATALAVSSIGASLLDLSQQYGALVNSISPMIGMAFGALLACMILQFSAHPLLIIFEILIVILVLQCILSQFNPETAKKRHGAMASLKPKISIPVQVKSNFLLISPVNIALWMVSGFYLSLMPSLLVRSFHIHSAWLNGLAFISLTIAGALGILYLRNHRTIYILFTGIVSMILGNLIILLGINLAQPVVLIIGSILTGVGFGTGFMGSIRSVMPLAKPEERAGLMSLFFIESYLAFSLPAIIAGFAVHHFGLMLSANFYILAIICLASFAFILTFKNKDIIH